MQDKPASIYSLKIIFKSLFARFWALWGLISFILTFLIFILPAMCCHLFKNYKTGQIYFIKIAKWWMNVWLTLIACPLTVVGRENFIDTKNYVVVFNHNAFLDVPLSAPYVPGANKTIGKDVFAKVPLFGWFYTRGTILVNRKDERSRIKSYEAMKKFLLLGIHVCIYPEGTRNRSSEPLKPFYDGAFKLAVETQKEIIPCLIFGTKKAMPIDKTFYLFPTALRMQFLPAVPTQNISVKDLKEKIFVQMKEFYEQKNI